MPKPLLPVTHWAQPQRADCVADCAKMVLDYIGQPVNYDRLLRLLQIAPLSSSGYTMFRKNGCRDEHASAAQTQN